MGAAAAGLGVLVSLSPAALELEESVGLRGFFALRGQVAAPDSVTVIGISAESAAAVDQPPELDEWSRAVHADLIDRLAALDAAAIVFDVSFDQERNAAEDRRLANAIANAGNVILFERVTNDRVEIRGGQVPASAEIETRVLPLPIFKDAAWGSAPFMLPRVPIRVNQFWAFGRSLGNTPTLPVVALQAYLAPTYEAFAAALTAVEPDLGDRLPRTGAELRTSSLEITVQRFRDAFRAKPDLVRRTMEHVENSGGQELAAQLEPLARVYGGRDSRYLNFYGPARTIRTIPYNEVFSPADDLRSSIADRVVFVGYSERRQPEQQDEFYSVYSERSGQSLSGVEIGATAFANLLDMSSLTPLTVPQHLGAVVLWGLVLGVLFAALPVPSAALAAVVAGVAYFSAAYLAFRNAGMFAPTVTPLLIQLPLALLAATVWSYRVVRAQGDRIRTALGYYVPQKVADRLAQETLETRSSGELLHGTCLFTDAEQYTAVAESMDPATLRGFMNDYYEAMFRAVNLNAGEIADLAGDSMVAIWAASLADPASRVRACRAALDVAAAVEEFNRSRGQRGLHTRIGLDAGAVFVGNIGAQQRYEYRAVGDIVSTASRIQDLNRHLRTQILVSDAACPQSDAFVTRELGLFRLRGKSAPLRIYELMGAEGLMSTRQDVHALCAHFAGALAKFQESRWAEAESALCALLERFPEDGPSAYYLEIAARYSKEPPAQWGGVLAVAEK